MDEAFYATYQAKLKQKTVLAPNGQCLLWTGTRCRLAGGSESQYGIIYAKCKQLGGGGLGWRSMRVHRFAYMLHVKSELSPEMHCSHLCHNSLCINVDHLILETPFVNGNRKLCAREKKCIGHAQSPPCIFFK